MKTLIKSASVVAPESDFHGKTTAILINDGKIEKITDSISIPVDKEIEFENLHVSPGWFDSSVSFGEPGFEERETLENGLHTAGKSGFSGILLNPDLNPVTDNRGSVEFLKNKANGSGTNLYPIGALTRNNDGGELAELFDMHKTGAVAFADPKKSVEVPNLLKIALLYAQGFGGLVQSFPTDQDLQDEGVVNEGLTSTQLGLKGIPALAEATRVARDLSILEYTGGKLHIPTISTKKSVEFIKRAKEKGLDVTCSVAIQNLCFTDEALQEFDSNFKVLPPLRAEADRGALIEAVKEGSIDMITSDHRPMDIEHKKLEFEQAEFGSLGLESAFGALNQIFGMQKAIKLLVKGRERFQLKTPEIKEGAEANLSLFNPEKNFTFDKNAICSSSKNSMFLGAGLKGRALGIFANNQLVLS